MMRNRSWLGWILAAMGLLLAIPAISIFLSLTSSPLHTHADAVPSTGIGATVAPQWRQQTDRCRQLVRAAVAKQNLPGVSVAVGVAGEIVWAEGFGFADIRSGEAVTPKHRFRIGTASVALTSAAVGSLLDEGRLQLDDPKLVSEAIRFPQAVTLRQLMGNTSGIRSDEGDEGPLLTRHCESPREAIPTFAAKPLRAEPGTQYRMASYGWIVVSAMLENAAKQPFLQAMRDRVFAPLGMQDTVADTQPKAEDEDFPLVNLFRELFHDPAATRAGTQPAGSATDRVTPYFPRLAANPVYGMHLMRPLDYSCYAGASVFVSTPSDLVRFAMGFPSLLKPHTAALLQSSQKLKSGQETGHGLGWYAKSIQVDGKQTRLVGQDGESLGGMIASLVTLPEHNIAVAVTSNISFADTYTIGLELARTFAAAR